MSSSLLWAECVSCCRDSGYSLAYSPHLNLLVAQEPIRNPWLVWSTFPNFSPRVCRWQSLLWFWAEKMEKKTHVSSVLSGGSLPVASSCIMPVTQQKSLFWIKLRRPKRIWMLLDLNSGLEDSWLFGCIWPVHLNPKQRSDMADRVLLTVLCFCINPLTCHGQRFGQRIRITVWMHGPPANLKCFLNLIGSMQMCYAWLWQIKHGNP